MLDHPADSQSRSVLTLRASRPLLASALVLVASVVGPSALCAQSEPSGPSDLPPEIEVITATETPGAKPFEVDRGPLDHLGWGTLEDLYVELGAGAAVNVFSGNLVLSLQPYVRGDAVADSQLGLTYNHLDTDGAPDLAPGWSYDLGRIWATGPWGDRILIDADGFGDSFFAGEPPTQAEGRKLMDDLTRAWRSSTPLRQRRDAGGERAFRDMLGSDPLFFGEMRMRLLGPPPPPPPSDEPLVWTSLRRGTRTMVEDRDDGSVRLSRPDGGVDVFDKEGLLVAVEPADSAPIRIEREAGRISSVEVGGSTRHRIYRDSWDRLHRVRSSAGREVVFEYVGRQLFRLRTPEGDFKFAYDGQGRLLVMDGPRGLLQVRYDGRSGRVVEARGPLGRVALSDTLGKRSEIVVRVDRGADGVSTATWLPEARSRRIAGSFGDSETQFEDDRPLPVSHREAGVETRFVWDAEGRLLQLAQDGETLRFERDDEGELTELIVPGGARASVDFGESGLVSWRDPEGRSTAVQPGPLGRPKEWSNPGGLVESIWRTKLGSLRSVAQSEGESFELRRDNRGFIRTVESVESGSLGLKVDAAGRLTDLDTPSGLSGSLRYGESGQLRSFSDGYSSFELSYDPLGRLSGWSGPWSKVELRRDDLGRPVGLTGAERQGWNLERDDAGRPTRLRLGELHDIRLIWDDEGRLQSWARDQGLGRRFDWGASGWIEGWTDDFTGSLSLRRDRTGQVIELQRGLGRWTLERDRSGLLTRLTEPSGAVTGLSLDAAGRAARIVGPAGLRYSLDHDAHARLTELRAGKQAWSLRFTRGGLPREWTGPGDAKVSLRWDRAGRPTALQRRGQPDLDLGYGPLGPTSIGAFRRSYARDGSLQSWGPIRSGSGWVVERNGSGRVRSVRWRDPPGSVGRLSEPPRHALQWNAKGQIVQAGDWEFAWTGPHLRRAEQAALGPDRFWIVERSRAGLVTGLRDGEDKSASIERDQFGDVSSLTAGEGRWTLERDTSGRLSEVRASSGSTWTLQRDAAGRIQAMERLGHYRLEWSPTDSSAESRDTSLARLYDVATDDPLPEGGGGPGSQRVWLRRAEGPPALKLDERRDAGGDLLSVEASFSEDLLPDGEIVMPQGLDPIADAIADAAIAADYPLLWGGAVVGVSTGTTFLPSAQGSGVAWASSDWLRLAGFEGGTITWIGRHAELNGLRFPSSRGHWTSPVPSLSYPSPPATIDPNSWSEEGPAGHRGVTRAVEQWWRSHEPSTQLASGLPRGLGQLGGPGSAWAETIGPSRGAGVVLPEIPGVRRSLPARRAWQQTTLAELLVLSGDLHPSALEHRRFMAVPRAAWSIAAPGLGLLSSVQQRRLRPTLPPGWSGEVVDGLDGSLDGLHLASRRTLSDETSLSLERLARGMPLGVEELLPGGCSLLPGGTGSIASDARCSALERLSDDPLVPGTARRALASDEGLLRAVQQLSPQRANSLSGLLSSEISGESWEIRLPSGATLRLDGWGRPRSLSMAGERRRSWAGLATALAGRSLLHPERQLPEEGWMRAPRFLPSESASSASSWGLVPATPELPLSGLGKPLLPQLRLGTALPVAPLTSWRRPIRSSQD